MAVLLGAVGVPHYTKDGKLFTGPTHKDASGRLMTGRTHTANSQFLFHSKSGIGEVKRILSVPKFMKDEIEESIDMGFNQLVVGMISKKRKGVLLINDNFQVRGTYDLGLKNYIENIIAIKNKKK